MLNVFLIYPTATVVGAGVHLAFSPKARAKNHIWSTILAWAILFNMGLSGLMGFYAHTFMADKTAQFIGWIPGSPFQFEVACANLAFGILGIISFWAPSSFRLAAILGYGVFLWGAAYGHIKQIIMAKNYAPGNAGTVLYADIIVPIVLLILWIIVHITSKRKSSHNNV